LVPVPLLATGSVSVSPGGAEPGEYQTLRQGIPLLSRLERGANLTLAALGHDALPWVERYQRRSVTTRSAEGFVEFVINRSDELVVLSMARFERALFVARREVRPTMSGAWPHHEFPPCLGEEVSLHPAACMVDLPGPADRVIGAVALGATVPTWASRPVLVAPGLPTLWRQASPAEEALCTWLTRPRATVDVLARFPGAKRVLPRLAAARAIAWVA